MRSTRGEDFAAVILDWQMPNMDGVQATVEIRRKVGDSIPVIILSAYDWTDVEQEARDIELNREIAYELLSMNDHISKPIDIPKLMEALETWLTHQ